ncbi:putative cytochrome P450 [Annulohypoxylon maeteangense]|uniref:putative cytochrome P450 n=1 Tax=Annulohypoxylon maeteangense TaxID=1927788 RepID=UPI0020075442|nr:putative cytochrome P450 [Annulohypoxylon maeteangense]KAI0885808.1 putative cytochrome P450 [Annulohypoxylon maeteangense]
MPELISIVLGILLLLLPIWATLLDKKKSSKNLEHPPRLGETIPFFTNGWQFMTNKRRFIERVKEALSQTPIVQCQLGPLKIYLITGGNNVSTIFRSSFTSEPWILSILENAAGYTPKDMSNFYADRSGATALPRRVSDGRPPPEKRIWYESHRMHDETLIGARQVNAFGTSFQKFFAQELAVFPVNEWVENIRIADFFKSNMVAAATRAVMGPSIIDLNPDFIDTFWQYEKVPEVLAFGLPTWLNRRDVRIRDKFNSMCRKWYELADREFDLTGPDQGVDWEPVFGTQVSKGLARWAKDFNFATESIGGAFALFLYGVHANAIPVCTWVMLELLKDPILYRAVKSEVEQARSANQTDGIYLDQEKVTSLPLLQSVFTEVMRLHVGVLITRTSTEPVTIAGYTLPKGSVVLAPTEVAHLDESVWGKPDHPASEFWGYRHVKEVETMNEMGHVTKALEFSIAGKSGSFFPYGGGISICTGRYFANAEVLLAISMILSRFEVEFIEWVMPDGSHSDRPALDDIEYANAVASPPDRDMKVRWRKMW